MATTIALSRYFDTVEDLSLTPEQESKLDEYTPMVRRMCRNFIERTRNHQGDDPLVSADDLIQLALVRLTVAIKHNKVKENEKRYYCRLVTRVCRGQVQCNRIRGNRDNHRSIDDPDNEFYLEDSRTDINRLHDRLYIKRLLGALKGKYTKKILIHFYGIETAPLYPKRISDIVPLDHNAIDRRRMRGLRSLKSRINRGVLPQWQT